MTWYVYLLVEHKTPVIFTCLSYEKQIRTKVHSWHILILLWYHENFNTHKLIVSHVKSPFIDIQLERVSESFSFIFNSFSFHLQNVMRVSLVPTVPSNARWIIMDVGVQKNVTALQTSTVIMSEDACVEIPVSIVQRKVRSLNSHLLKINKHFFTWLALVISEKTVQGVTTVSSPPCEYNALF